MATQAITFDYAAWVAAYPLFSGINSADAQSYFDGAGMYCANDVSNPAFGVRIPQNNVEAPLLQRLLWLLTCHLAYLGAFRDASGKPASNGTVQPTTLVGRVSSAAEGSVNVSTELDASGYPMPAFFAQTPWGLQFWQATVQFRNAVYVPAPCRSVIGAVYPSGIFPRRAY